MQRQPSKPVIRACVLAAGSSARFGKPKLLQRFRGKPLLQHALLAAQEVCKGKVLLVVGHGKNAIGEASAGLADDIVVNADHELGMGTSIAAGVRACPEDTAALLILLADQPLITTVHLKNIIGAWHGGPDEIVTSSCDGIFSPPILFAKTAFQALRELEGDEGARRILTNKAFQLTNIEFAAAGLDIDTPEDLQRLNRD